MPYVLVLSLGLVYGRRLRPRNHLVQQPTVSVFIPTYNEEKYIAKKLENVLSQTQPIHEILVFDCSSDSTPKVVEEYQRSNQNIKLFRQAQRTGMPKTLNEAIKAATGEVFVYTGCDSFTEAGDALERLVSHFSDSQVGGVTGLCVNSGLEGQFRKFSNWIQRAESNMDSTIIAHGGPSLVGFRRELLEPVREDSLADDTEEFVRIRKKGFKTVVDPDVMSREVIPDSFTSRRIQKDRRAQGIVRVIFQNLDVAFNPKYGLYGLAVFPMDLFLLVVSPFLLLLDLALVGYLLFILNPIYLFVFGVLIGLSVLLSTKVMAIVDMQLAGLVGSIRAFLGKGSNLWPKERLRPS